MQIISKDFKTENAGGGLAQLIIMVVVIGWSFNLAAQDSKYFTVNGRNINVDSLNQEIVKMMDDIGIPGLTFAVIDNNRIVFNEVYGYKNLSKKKKVNNNTIFEACSLSKSFLVFVAHQLVDQGKLDLDRPLYQYLKNKRLEYDPRYKLITARMVLSHCSGIENWGYHNNSNILEILSNPGEKYVYSGEGYNYLAKVIETILNQSFEEYINERIINPMKLRRTYLKYKPKSLNPFHKGSPVNYALGYSSFNDELNKWKNRNPVPSSAINLIAKDYAKLIVSIFNGKYLSIRRTEEILDPVIIANENDSSEFRGVGFALHYCDNDTLISQGGSNSGFKARLLYSATSNCGFVFFTNNERGWAVCSKLNQLTTNFSCSLFDNYGYYWSYYPSLTIDLLKTYRESGSYSMFHEIKMLIKEGRMNINTLNELGDEFSRKDEKISIKLLEKNKALYPQSPSAYWLLGKIYMKIGDYNLALKNLEKAKELNFKERDVEKEIESCKDELHKRHSICSRYIRIIEDKLSVIQAEDYCTMHGIQVENTLDNGGQQNVGWIDMGDWMDYKVNIPSSGTYTLEYRVASISGNGQIQFKIEDNILTTTNIPNTQGWQNWTTVSTTTSLTAGNQIIRLYASGAPFNINWFRLCLSPNNVE